MEAKKAAARKSRLGARPSASASSSAAAKVFSLKQKTEGLPSAPQLVGRIVEKGFSPDSDSDSSSLAPSSLPQPTVLPFPVARHRSHGPHWSPTIPDQELFEEDMDVDMDGIGYDSVATFAKPIERKEKKELNFSQWRDLVSNNDPNPPKIRQKVVKPSPKTTEREIKEINVPLIKDVPMRDAQEETSQNLRPVSLREEIDSENTARLNQMSAEEIAEVQKEIMEKMNPALLDMLKRRGKNKLENRSDSERERNREVKQKDAGATAGDWLKQSHGRVGDDSWKNWSNRVERVRLYRFKLNGDVLGIDPSLQQKDGQYKPDSVAERDFLRTEGDPAAIGYTINEAVSLTRSVIPGQRALALQLLTSILNNSLHDLQQEGDISEKGVDWQAVWAFALGPEPQLALSLRMALDDNHESVVLACARAIQSVLAYDMNENYFDISEKLPIRERHICTAPVFRTRPDLNQGFLRGGFWKYNTKPSNLLPDFHESENEGEDGNITIRDDIVVAEQDIAAGFIRMGILPRICYLLEMEPHPNLEEMLISILVALARHSPQSSDAILRCPRLIQAVGKVLMNQQMADISSLQIKAVTFLKILSKYDKRTCFELINHGIFQLALWNWFKSGFTLDNWITIKRENLKLSSSMLVEQLRFWRVYINHGLCISHFVDFFPVLCLFLTPPIFEKLVDENALEDFASVTAEAYLALYDLSLTLPILHSSVDTGTGGENVEKDTWKWSHAIPMVDLAVKWLELKSVPYFPPVISHDEDVDTARGCPLIWVFSSVLHMLNGVLQKIAPVDRTDKSNELRWLPDFVPRLGLALTNDFLEQNRSLLKKFSGMRKIHRERNIKSEDAILASMSCIQGLVQVANFVDSLVRRAKNACPEPQLTADSMTGGEILAAGIVNWAHHDLSEVFSMITADISSKWLAAQCLEVFGRVGPAPGIGFGWGSKGGGFWSLKSVLSRLDSRLVLDFIEIFPVLIPSIDVGINIAPDARNLRTINSLLGACLMVGPGDRTVLEKAIHMLFQAPVLKYLVFCINYYIPNVVSPTTAKFNFSEDEFSLFSEALISHFKSRWLDVKKKLKKEVKQQHENSLETIHEEVELMEKSERDNFMVIEWAHQRLPMPLHWFLSPLCGSRDMKIGLVLLLGLETLLHISESPSPLSGVALVWKLHSLSMCLSSDIDVLGEEKSRAVFEIIQEKYSQDLRKLQSQSLDFQKQIHENYSTFLEHCIEQFSAVSYGDVLYGRQVAIYLHRMVETGVRLNAWNLLTSACVLELLPPLESCVGGAHGYLEPAEDNDGILEAYAKSWISGGLDRAANRKSMAFTLAVHHLSSFLFNSGTDEKQVVRNKLMKSLLRYYSQKRQSEGMLKSLMENELDVSQEKLYREEISRRFEVMKTCCEGNSSLLMEVEKLRESTNR
ncbi:RNA polymerase II-associated protein 1 [Rhynchospora pubera]|uniref:RNA polymerase II-associated protein 1 n=1 Tax=Rhynchospora pubera TaxID=906938 RepID=A0AAV8DU42_9POAL|nr:RNA polymerase II-associated protein 1 [Rhynchospora pubera]